MYKRQLLATPASSQERAATSAPPATAPCPKPRDEARPWLSRNASPVCRAKSLLETLTLEEKLDILTTGDPGEGAWLTRHGLPVLKGGDGPAGVNQGGVSVTAFPVPLSIAATFDVEAANRSGRLLGAEFFAYGLNWIGGPSLDMTRSWRFGRSSESFGEDPFLAAQIGAAQIRGVQSQHVLTRAKHFAGYTQEAGRTGDHPLRLRPAVNTIVSERALREIYLPPFKAAVEAGIGEIMCAFPRINGVYACEHPHLLGILKNEWGFDGLVVPDYPDAQRSIVAAVQAGLDRGVMTAEPPTEGPGPLGIPIDNTFNGENLRQAVRDGAISHARIDDLLLRQLVPNFRIGTYDNPARRAHGDVSTAARRDAAAALAVQAAVLLKNKDGILPFTDGVRSIALIGDAAGPRATVSVLGSAHVAPMHLRSGLSAVNARAGSSTSVQYARGTLGLDMLPLVPPSMVTGPAGAAGFKAEYFDNPRLDFSGTPFLVRQEAAVNNVSLPAAFPKHRQWSARWTGRFMPGDDGIHHFTLHGSGTARLFVDGKNMGTFTDTDFADTIYADIPMKAGKAVDLRVEWTPRLTMTVMELGILGTTLGPVVKLGWEGPNRLIADAVEQARKADVAVVVVGHKVGEGMSRESLDLPGDQNALIEAVATANPRTIVVLQTGGPVSMPWLDRVAGVLQMWLPGDTAGTALAHILFGDEEPGGRLPITFPRDERQGPGQEAQQYPGIRDATGALQELHLDEGLLIGYRFWDAKSQTPLFPFGHGLSYTSFKVRASEPRLANDGSVEIDVSVMNTGRRRGASVLQAYLGFPAGTGEPPRQLKAMQRVEVERGATGEATLRLPCDAFRLWDEAGRAWRTPPGEYRIEIGTSSRDIVTEHTVAIGAGAPSCGGGA